MMTRSYWLCLLPAYLLPACAVPYPVETVCHRIADRMQVIGTYCESLAAPVAIDACGSLEDAPECWNVVRAQIFPKCAAMAGIERLAWARKEFCE